MSIQREAKVLIGTPYINYLTALNAVALDALDDDLDNGDLDYCSPYYDCERHHWIVGVDIVNLINGKTLQEVIEVLTDIQKSQEENSIERFYISLDVS